MSCFILELQAELQLEVAELLEAEDHESLCNWCCTCSFYRTLLSPVAFKRVKLRNDGRSGDSVLHVAHGSRKHLVKELYYTGYAPETDQETHDPQDILAQGTRSVLSNLRLFPKLEKVSIGFSMSFEQDIEYDEIPENGWSHLWRVEDTEAAEKTDCRCALMAQTLSALAQNKARFRSTLELRQLPPLQVSTVTSSDFHVFLRSVTNFSLSLYKGPGGWTKDTFHNYSQFTSRLGLLFLDHLSATTSLNFAAALAAPMGLAEKGLFDPQERQRTRHMAHPLGWGRMRSLERVSLSHIFIDERLVEFLLGHLSTLRFISLHDCYGCIDLWPTGLTHEPWKNTGFCWSTLFSAIVEATDPPPAELATFELRFSTPNLRYMDHNASDLEGEEMGHPEEIRRIADLVRESEGVRRLFAYTTLNKYGTMEVDSLAVRVAFLRGDDQMEYDRLMRLIAANNAAR